jgi:hypothetical protein
MNCFRENIDQQIKSSQGKNLFNDQAKKSLKFIEEIIQSFGKIGDIDQDTENLLIDYTTDKVLREFCRINQYYTFNKQTQIKLKDLYKELFVNLKNQNYPVDFIAENHYKNLTKWLTESNSFAEKIYSSKDEILEPVTCSEYSPELQIKILQIDPAQIIEPVLDIGCGKQGNLVLFLRNLGIEAYGFDRFTFNDPFLANSDWLEFDYGINKWGSIVSNLGFTNHFKHHHLRDDGNFVGYAKTYMEILNALKSGGCFYYAPGLPFIEQFLDKDKYKMTSRKIGEYDFKSVKVERLK